LLLACCLLDCLFVLTLQPIKPFQFFLTRRKYHFQRYLTLSAIPYTFSDTLHFQRYLTLSATPYTFGDTLHFQRYLTLSATPYTFSDTLHFQRYLTLSATPYTFSDTLHFQRHLTLSATPYTFGEDILANITQQKTTRLGSSLLPYSGNFTVYTRLWC